MKKQKYIYCDGVKWPIYDKDGDHDQSIYKVSHPIFKAVEVKFWEWLDKYGDNDPQLREMYVSDDAIYEIKDAIRQGIEHLVIALEESDKTMFWPSDYYLADFEAAFQD